MKKVKTPILLINGMDYTNDLKGTQIKAGENIFSSIESTLSDSSFTMRVRRPYKKLHGYTDIADPNNLIVNGVLYDSNLNVILENVTASHNSTHYISNGALYHESTMVSGESSGWTDLSNEGTDYGTFLGIKNGALYMLEYTTKQITPQTQETLDLYAYTCEYEIETIDPDSGATITTTTTHTIYLNESPEIGSTIYNEYLIELGDVETITEQGIEYADGHGIYERDVDKDTTSTKTIPATYQTTTFIDLIDDSKTYIKVCGNCGKQSSNSGTNGYALSSDNKFYKIDFNTKVISLVYSNITDLYKSPRGRQSFLIKASNGTVRHIKFQSGYSDSSFSQKIDSDVQFIAPEGYWGAAYNTNVITIRDGNLYNTWTTQIDGKGYWTQISTGYECGYGICDGKLYKLYGTNSFWYIKVMEEPILLDDNNIWVDLYCGYSDAYALTSDGKLYYIKNEKLTLTKTRIPLGVDYNTEFIPEVTTINVGQSDQTRNITISKSLLDILLSDAQP